MNIVPSIARTPLELTTGIRRNKKEKKADWFASANLNTTIHSTFFKKKMKLFIPTYKRTERQLTWNNLPESVREYTYLVCPEKEVEVHTAADRQVIGTPKTIKGIAQTRQWVIENSDDDQVFFADDDQSFKTREEDSYKLRAMVEEDYTEMVLSVLENLKE
jgi:hypothetical protein